MIRPLLLRIPVLAALLASAAVAAAGAAEPPLTRARIAQLVVDAPPSRVARSEAAVYGAAAGASGGPIDNPVLTGLGGVRRNPDGSRPVNAQVSLSWPFELSGRRGASRGAARADRRVAQQLGVSGQRLLLLEALLQYQAVLKDQRELALAEARHALSQRFYATAQRRQAAGAVPELDVALAALQQQRDASALAAAQGARDADVQRLAALLGLPAVTVASAEVVPEGEVPPLEALLAATAQHPELQTAETELHAARARAGRARAERWPTLSALLQYERDDGADIGMLGLEVPLPLLNANRVEVATSTAEVAVAEAKLAQARARLEGQVRELHARYLATRAALDALAPTEALATRAVNVATRGYELGESDLTSVLLVRREALEAQVAQLAAQHGHAVVKLELLVGAGRHIE